MKEDMEDEDRILSTDEFFEAEDVEPEGDVDVNIDEEDDDIQSIDSDADEKQDLDEGRSLYLSMLDADLQTFLSRLRSYAPINDKKHVKIRLKTIDWENVAFGRYGAKECELIWGFLQTKTRKYRILDELINEIKYNTESVEDKEKFWKKILESDPSFPKKPPGATSAYNAYCYEMYQKEANKPNYFLFAQKCQETFNSLPAKEKKKYQNKSDLVMANFEKQVKEFYSKHPNVTPMSITITKKGASWQFPRVTQVQRRKDRANDPPPVLPSTAMVNFIQHKLNRIHPAPSKDDLKGLKIKYRDAYKALNKRTKGKWIDKHIRNIDQYLKDLEAYIIKYSYYEPKKTFVLSEHLSKPEIALWEEYKGKPFFPASAQKVFNLEFQRENEDKTSEQLKELMAVKWKELGWYQKEEYGLKYKKAVMDYKTQIGEYFANLPDFLKDSVFKTIPKKFQSLTLNVSKLPTDPNILNVKAEVVTNNEIIEEEPEQEEEEPPKKKKKKSKKRDDELPTTSTRPNGTSNISEINEDDEEPSYSKKKKKKKKHKQSEDEETTEVTEETEEEQVPIYKKALTDYDKLRVLEERKRERKMDALQREVREMADLKRGKKIEDIITNKSKTISKPNVKDFSSSKKILQRNINEALRGIFDGRQILGRYYSTYYFYAKYVASDPVWISAYNDAGACECAEKIVQTFNSLPNHEKQVFIDQSQYFFIIQEYGNDLENASAEEENSVPKRKRRDNFYFVGEPPEPPRNAISLYRKEMVQLHNEKKPGVKRPQITPWQDLDESVQQMYIRKLYQMTNAYLKNYENFILKMTPNDMIAYTLARGKYWEYSYMKNVPNLDTARGFTFPLSNPISEEIHGSEPEILTHKPVTSEERKAERIRRNPLSSENDLISKITEAVAVDPLLINELEIVDGNLSIREREIVADESDSDLPSSDSEEDVKPKVFHKADLISYKQIKKESTYHYPVKNVELPILSKGQQKHRLVRMRNLQEKVAEAEAIQQGQGTICSTSNASEENPAESNEEGNKAEGSGWYTRGIKEKMKIKRRANRPVRNLNDRLIPNRKRIITPAFVDTDSDSTIVPSSPRNNDSSSKSIETETQLTP